MWIKVDEIKTVYGVCDSQLSCVDSVLTVSQQSLNSFGVVCAFSD